MRVVLADSLRTSVRTEAGARLRFGLWAVAAVTLWITWLARNPEQSLTVERAAVWGEWAGWGLIGLQTLLVTIAAPWAAARAVLRARSSALDAALLGARRPYRAQLARVAGAVWPVIAASWAVVPALAAVTVLGGPGGLAVASAVFSPVLLALSFGAVAATVAQRADSRWVPVLVSWLIAWPVWLAGAPVAALFCWDPHAIAEVAPWAAAWVDHPAHWVGWVVGVPLISTSVDVAVNVGRQGPNTPIGHGFWVRRGWKMEWLALVFLALVFSLMFPITIAAALVIAGTISPAATLDVIPGLQIPLPWLAIPGKLVFYAFGLAGAAFWTRLGLMVTLDGAWWLDRLPSIAARETWGRRPERWQRLVRPWLWGAPPVARWLGLEPAAAATQVMVGISALLLAVMLAPTTYWAPGAPALLLALAAGLTGGWVAHGGGTATRRAALEAPGLASSMRRGLLRAGLALASPLLGLALLARLAGLVPEWLRASELVAASLLPMGIDLAMLPGLVLLLVALGRWMGRLDLGRASLLLVSVVGVGGWLVVSVFSGQMPSELRVVTELVGALPRSAIADPVALSTHVTSLLLCWLLALLATATAAVGR